MLRLNRSNLSYQQFEDKIYVLTTQSNSLHELNGTASQIFLWLWNEEEVTEPMLVTRIGERYEVDEAKAREHLALFLADLRGKGILLPE